MTSAMTRWWASTRRRRARPHARRVPFGLSTRMREPARTTAGPLRPRATPLAANMERGHASAPSRSPTRSTPWPTRSLPPSLGQCPTSTSAAPTPALVDLRDIETWLAEVGTLDEHGAERPAVRALPSATPEVPRTVAMLSVSPRWPTPGCCRCSPRSCGLTRAAPVPWTVRSMRCSSRAVPPSSVALSGTTGLMAHKVPTTSREAHRRREHRPGAARFAARRARPLG